MARSGTAAVMLPTDEQILITPEFDAPKHHVYRAWTTPELARRWWSANRGEVTVVDVDLRVGGVWRYVMVADGGFEVAFRSECREIVPNERRLSRSSWSTRARSSATARQLRDGGRLAGRARPTGAGRGLVALSRRRHRG